MGVPEIAVIVIVAVIVFGPEKLPELARQAGRLLRTVRQMADNAKNDLAREMGDDFAGIKDMNIRDLDPREAIRKAIFDDDTPTKPVSRSTAPGRRLDPGETPPYDAEST